MKHNQPLQHRQSILAVTLLVVVALLLSACGTKEPKTVTIGALNTLAPTENAIDGFKADMAEFGYIEGENLTYIYAGVIRDAGELEAAAQDLVEANVDLIFSITTAATLAAQRATAGTDVPVIFVAVRDPVKSGIVKSIREPGGNITGISSSGPATLAVTKRLDRLLQIAPEAQRIYVPYEPGERMDAILAAISEAAEKLGVELVLDAASTPEEVTEMLETIPEDVDAIFWVGGQAFGGFSDQFINAALERSLPISVSDSDGPRKGGLTSFGSDFFAGGKQAARLADQVLRGTDPSSMPVEQPEFLLIINLKTAEAIGLDIPDAILRQAEKIIR